MGMSVRTVVLTTSMMAGKFQTSSFTPVWAIKAAIRHRCLPMRV